MNKSESFKVELLLYGGFFLQGVGFILGYIMLLDFSEQNNLNDFTLSSVLCIDLAIAVLTCFFIKKLFSGVTRIKLLLFSYLLGLVSTFMQSFIHLSPSLTLVYISRALNGPAIAISMSCIPAIILSYSSHRAEMVLSLLQTLFSGGLIISPALIYISSSLQLIGLMLCLLYISIGFLTFRMLSKSSPSQEKTEFSIIYKPVTHNQRLVLELLIQFSVGFSFTFIYSTIELYPEYTVSMNNSIVSVSHIYAISNFLCSIVEVPISKLFRHEGRIICSGLFVTSLGFCLFSRSIYSYFPAVAKFTVSIEIAAIALLGVGNALMFIPTYSRMVKTANKHYCIEKTESLINGICILGSIFTFAGRMAGVVLAVWMSHFVSVDIGVLVVSIFANLLMIVYSFLTDVFNLFNEGLMDKLNDIEVIDLSAIHENEIGGNQI